MQPPAHKPLHFVRPFAIPVRSNRGGIALQKKSAKRA
jgi:hypothetical protein